MRDNFDFADDEDKRLAKLEAEAEHCDWCGEAMYECYYEIGQDKVCDRCIDDRRHWI